ncbi:MULTISPECIES: XisH family protein [Nostoc]|nr:MULTISPECIES: XisH family protein [Nostoc]
MFHEAVRKALEKEQWVITDDTAQKLCCHTDRQR